MTRKNSFTLIELICVVAILSILAAMILPRYNNMRNQAIEKQEDAVITALKEAFNHRHMQKVLAGQDVWAGSAQDPYASGSPFEMLSPSPPYRTIVTGATTVAADSTNWVSQYIPAGNNYHIYCPHYNGTTAGNVSVTPAKGRMYMLFYSNFPPNYKAGECNFYKDFLH